MISNPIRGLCGSLGRVALMTLTLAGAAFVNLAGCTVKSSSVPIVTMDDTVSPDAIVVPGNRAWVDTGIDVVAGQPLTIVGKGRIAIGKMQNAAGDTERELGPQGTFFYDDRYSQVRFPLPAAGN